MTISNSSVRLCCLTYVGHSWRFLALHALEANIQKARRPFLNFGSIGTFQEILVTRLVVETCVVPVLIYGCENWILTERILEHLELVQCIHGTMCDYIQTYIQTLLASNTLMWGSLSLAPITGNVLVSYHDSALTVPQM